MLQTIPRPIKALVIGASSGGVEALLTLLPSLPESLGIPVFVVLHIPRDRPSRLVELFQHKCVVVIREALDKEPVEPGVLYFAPPDYHLLVEAGPQIALSCDDPVHFSRPSIDCLFESAADEYRENLVGIILTGASEDGAAGLAAIKHQGGFTIVQTPEVSRAPAMPLAAIQAAQPHLVLSLSAIADLLGALPRLDS